MILLAAAVAAPKPAANPHVTIETSKGTAMAGKCCAG